MKCAVTVLLCVFCLWLISLSSAQRGIPIWPTRNRNPNTNNNRRNRLRNLLVKPRYQIATVQVEPFLFRNGTGYIKDLLEELSQLSGFQYDLTVYSQDRIGVGNLLIEKVANRKFDVAAGLLTVTPLREFVVDFTRPFARSRPNVLVGVPDEPDLTFASSLAASPVPVGTLMDSGMVDKLRNSEKTVFKNLWHVIRSHANARLVETLHDGVQKIRHGNFSLILDGPIAKYQEQQDPCALRARPVTSEYFTYAFAVGKQRSDVLKRLNNAISNTVQNGFLSRLRRKYWDDSVQCDDYYYY